MKTKQETNIIGAMLLVLLFFLIIGMAIEIALEGRTVGIDEITGAVSGMEKVSGFGTFTRSDPSTIGNLNFFVENGKLKANWLGIPYDVEVEKNKIGINDFGGNTPLTAEQIRGFQSAPAGTGVPEIMIEYGNQLGDPNGNIPLSTIYSTGASVYYQDITKPLYETLHGLGVVVSQEEFNRKLFSSF